MAYCGIEFVQFTDVLGAENARVKQTWNVKAWNTKTPASNDTVLANLKGNVWCKLDYWLI